MPAPDPRRPSRAEPLVDEGLHARDEVRIAVGAQEEPAVRHPARRVSQRRDVDAVRFTWDSNATDDAWSEILRRLHLENDERLNTSDLSADGRERWMGEKNAGRQLRGGRSEEHTSELQSPKQISYAVFCLKKKKSQV